MKLFHLALLAAFALQATCLVELIHVGEESCASACGAGHEEEGKDPSHQDCHWHCANCVHASVSLEMAQALLPATTAIRIHGLAHDFVPTVPPAKIFHPPA